MNNYVTSPCIRQCTLNDEDVCVGCFRSRREILDWLRMTENEQRSTIDRCEQRRAKNKKSLLQKLKKLAVKRQP